MKIEVCYGILNILRRCSRPKPFETTLGHKGQWYTRLWTLLLT